ncbi:myosin IB heavy chain [Elysia marginata]|uniref:Myosin IB heavy chain n=1 Tax=Elysia marginata TaxID=1093978 RepID=A0AAV4HEG8_9GAST|nr:myosin IB heavy chain [Elysia marginata]
MDESKHPYISTQWYLGRRHIFYSEGTRQSLETMRGERIRSAATTVQASWRGYRCRKSVRAMRTQARAAASHLTRHVTSQSRAQNKTRQPYNTSSLTPTTPRPQLPPKGEKIERVEPAVLAYVCNMWGLDPAKKPSDPPKRTYSVHGNVKISYPQSRCMKTDFPEASGGDCFKKGDIVTVLGPSGTRGHHIVQKGDIILHVPYTRMAIQRAKTEEMEMDWIRLKKIKQQLSKRSTKMELTGEMVNAT